jgi:hypothetical protein
VELVYNLIWATDGSLKTYVGRRLFSSVYKTQTQSYFCTHWSVRECARTSRSYILVFPNTDLRSSAGPDIAFFWPEHLRIWTYVLHLTSSALFKSSAWARKYGVLRVPNGYMSIKKIDQEPWHEDTVYNYTKLRNWSRSTLVLYGKRSTLWRSPIGWSWNAERIQWSWYTMQ